MTAQPSAPIGHLVVAGLGLMGGSIALAARARGVARRVTALGRDAESLERALASGVVDAISTNERTALADADFVVLCQPVDVIVESLPRIMAAVPPRAIVTDAGSTKEAIVKAAEEHQRHFDAVFVGSHPMAGSDRSGWENASESLYDDATVFVTVTNRTDKRAVARTGRFWTELGARPLYVSPRRHDRLMAVLSHVPHLAAVAVVELLRRGGEDPQILRWLAGPGLRDTTRVAQGSPEMWEQICHQNAGSIAELLDTLGSQCHELARAVREGDGEGLRQTLERARALRQAIGSHTPPQPPLE